MLAVSDHVVSLLASPLCHDDTSALRGRAEGRESQAGWCHQLKARGAGVVGLVAVIVKCKVFRQEQTLAVCRA